MNHAGRIRRLAIVYAFCAVLPVPGRAERIFVAVLNGQQNVPPIPLATATGSAHLVLNDAEDQVTFHMEYTGLLGLEIAAHFHNAGPRANGPILFTLPAGSPKDGTWAVSTADVAELIAGRVYINIHTSVYNVGEIRGNLTEMIIPVVPTTIGAIKALFDSGGPHSRN